MIQKITCQLFPLTEIKKHSSLVKAIKERMAELFNLNEYISIYYDLQSEKSKILKQYASNKKMAVDLNRFAKARIYLKDHKLETIADL